MAYQTTGTITGMDVFQRAITMMDELNDAGQYRHADTKEYQDRTLAILNVLQNELYPYSDTCPKYTEWEKGRRPVLLPLEDLYTEIDLDDYCSGTVLPYGLAAHLLLDENPSAAGYFQQRYDELKAMLMSGAGRPGESEDIMDLYGPCGGIYPYNELSRWA
jgi:hypothetical protein